MAHLAPDMDRKRGLNFVLGLINPDYAIGKNRFLSSPIMTLKMSSPKCFIGDMVLKFRGIPDSPKVIGQAPKVISHENIPHENIGQVAGGMTAFISSSPLFF